MARTTHVKKAQQRYETVPVLDESGAPKTVAVMKADGSPKLTKKGKPIVREVTVADKSRPLPNHTCGKCGVEIKPGDPYKWIKPKSGPYGGTMRVRCEACPSWRPSETTGSAALSALYGAQEAASDALSAWSGEDGADALSDILSECAQGVREAAEVYRESAQNMEDGFGHSTMQSDELNEKADTLEAAADELESWESSEGEFDESDVDLDEIEDDADDEDRATREAANEDLIEQAREEWAETLRDEAMSAVDDIYV